MISLIRGWGNPLYAVGPSSSHSSQLLTQHPSWADLKAPVPGDLFPPRAVQPSWLINDLTAGIGCSPLGFPPAPHWDPNLHPSPTPPLIPASAVGVPQSIFPPWPSASHWMKVHVITTLCSHLGTFWEKIQQKQGFSHAAASPSARQGTAMRDLGIFPHPCLLRRLPELVLSHVIPQKWSWSGILSFIFYYFFPFGKKILLGKTTQFCDVIFQALTGIFWGVCWFSSFSTQTLQKLSCVCGGVFFIIITDFPEFLCLLLLRPSERDSAHFGTIRKRQQQCFFCCLKS